VAKTVKNIDPKNLKPIRGTLVIDLLQHYPPTDRHILWIIANRKQALNPLYLGQYAAKNPAIIQPGGWLNKVTATLGTLKVRGFIKQDKELSWHVTVSGQLHRLTTHPQWILIQLFLAAILALIVGIIISKINQAQPSKQPQESVGKKYKENAEDSALQFVLPFQKMEDSLRNDSVDTSATNSKDSNQKPQQ
jgi:hypothetical protein